MVINLLTLLTGYLLGSISTGVLLSHFAAHTDIRQQGSGNAGTTNMLRVMGKKFALLTLAGDMLKGIVAVLIGSLLVGGKTGQILGAFGAILGHNFPVFFGFKGGKGIATSFGALLFVFPVQALLAFVVFFVLVAVTHYVSLGSVAAAITLPLLVIFTTPYNPPVYIITAFIGASVVWRHRANIRRLLQHTENKLDFATLKKKKG